MSVDYYSCSVCGDARYEEAVISCENCGESICNECVNYDKELGDECQYYFPDYVSTKDWELKKEYCPYCSGKVVNETDLIVFMLSKLGMSRDEVEKEFLEKRGTA